MSSRNSSANDESKSDGVSLLNETNTQIFPEMEDGGSRSTTPIQEECGDKVHKERNRRKIRAVEMCIVTIAVLLIWAAFFLPLISFIQSSTESQVSDLSEDNGTSNENLYCTEAQIYTGVTCREELLAVQECFSGSQTNPKIRIPSNIDQEDMERRAAMLANGLPFLYPSESCEVLFRSFICLYMFGSCDSYNQSHQPSRGECVKVKRNICRREWKKAELLLGDGVLPKCTTFKNHTETCLSTANATTGMGMDSIQQVTTSDAGDYSQNNCSQPNATCTTSMYTCPSGFYQRDYRTPACTPKCGSFVYPNRRSIIPLESGFVITSAIICLACLAAVTVIACRTRHTLLTFPMCFIVYLCVTSGIFALSVLTSYINNAKLFCSSLDLVDIVTTEGESTFCTISGMVYNYCTLQWNVFAVLYTISIFWGTVFPNSYQNFQSRCKITSLHILATFLAVIVPFIPALIHLKYGYTIQHNPPIFCVGRETSYTFYTQVIPNMVMSAFLATLALLSFWVKLKKYNNTTVKPFPLQAYIWMVVVLLFSIILVVLATIYYKLAQLVDNSKQTQNYILCESKLGSELNATDCNNLLDSYLFAFGSVNVLSVIVQMLIPLAILAVMILFSCKAKISDRESDRTLKMKLTKLN